MAKMVKDLDSYPYSGHSALMGRYERPWLDAEYVLALFGSDTQRVLYREFINAGIAQGHRIDLAGGGLGRNNKT